MRAFVTGADGFVGRWMVRNFLEAGHDVVGGTLSGDGPSDGDWAGVRWLRIDVTEPSSVQAALAEPYDWVVHLAAISSAGECRMAPAAAWTINAVGTALVAQTVADTCERHGHESALLVASTAEVYGEGAGEPRTEKDGIAPCSPYGSSKAAAELTAIEVGRRTDLRVVIARAFPHTGPGQDLRFVVPAFANRLLTAKRINAPVVKVGRLDIVREFLDVRDVVRAYRRLLETGEGGEAYNVCCGEGLPLRELFDRLADLVEHRSIPEVDPDLVRTGEIMHLVGDPTKIHQATGWKATTTLEKTLTDLVHAQTD